MTVKHPLILCQSKNNGKRSNFSSPKTFWKKFVVNRGCMQLVFVWSDKNELWGNNHDIKIVPWSDQWQVWHSDKLQVKRWSATCKWPNRVRNFGCWKNWAHKFRLTNLQATSVIENLKITSILIPIITYHVVLQNCFQDLSALVSSVCLKSCSLDQTWQWYCQYNPTTFNSTSINSRLCQNWDVCCLPHYYQWAHAGPVPSFLP